MIPLLKKLSTTFNFMEFRNILKTAKQKIQNPSRLDRALYMDTCDIESFAKTAVINDAAKSQIINALTGAAAGATLAGGATALSTKRREDEDEGAHRRRMIKDSIVSALAGAAVGGAAPTLIGGVQSMIPKEKTVVEKALGIIPNALKGAVVPGAAAAATFGVDQFMHGPDKMKKLQELAYSGSAIGKDMLERGELIKGKLPGLSKYLNMKGNAVQYPTGFAQGGAKLLGKDILQSLTRGKLRNPAIAALIAAAGLPVANTVIDSQFK
jgi:hypothetical protein